MTESKKELVPQEGDEAVDPDLERTISTDNAIKSFLGGDGFVNDMLGINLKPVTLSSLAMMQEAGCEIISGMGVDEMDNLMLEILLFIYIHTVEHEELVNIVCSGEDSRLAMKRSALSLGVEIKPKQIPAIVERIVEILTEATDTKVEPLPDKDEVMGKKKKENAGG